MALEEEIRRTLLGSVRRRERDLTKCRLPSAEETGDDSHGDFVFECHELLGRTYQCALSEIEMLLNPTVRLQYLEIAPQNFRIWRLSVIQTITPARLATPTPFTGRRTCHAHSKKALAPPPRPSCIDGVLTEADLDMELEMEARGGDDCRDHDHHGHNDHGHHHGDAFSHGHSHSRWFGGYGQCHGFEQDNFTGGWINAGHAENVFGGTGFGRRIVPVARATRVRRRLYGALAVSGAYALAEVIAATISGSTALLADALHMLSDFISYALSIGILELTLRKMKGYRKVKSVDPDSDLEAARGSTTDDYDSWLTFGFGRVEVLGATGIILVVWIATLALVVEAFQRLVNPPEVDGMTVVITTLGGLVVDVALLRLLDRERDGNGNSHGHSHGTGELGARAMFLHVVGDLIGTIVVCVGGAIIWGTGGRDSHLAVVDPVSTLIFAVIVFATTFPFFKRMMRTLLEATPPGLDLKKLTETLESKVPGVVGIHCLHAWDVSPGKAAFMAHVHVDISGRGVEAMELVLRRATRLLSTEFGIQHVTLQVTAVPEQGGFSACGQLRKEPEKCPICDGD